MSVRKDNKNLFPKLVARVALDMTIGDMQRTLILRAVRGRIDYTLFNYCAGCGYKLPKDILRCPDCRQKVRTRPWHRSHIIDLKRV